MKKLPPQKDILKMVRKPMPPKTKVMASKKELDKRRRKWDNDDLSD